MKDFFLDKLIPVAVYLTIWLYTPEALKSVGISEGVGVTCSTFLLFGLGLLALFILSRFDNRGYNNFLNKYLLILTSLIMVILWIPVLVVINVFQA